MTKGIRKRVRLGFRPDACPISMLEGKLIYYTP